MKFYYIFLSIFQNFLLITIIDLNSLNLCFCRNVAKKSVDENRDDYEDTKEEAKDESLDIPDEDPQQLQLGVPANVTCTRRANTQMHEIRTATNKQFPFVASVVSHQFDHLCSATVVSNGLLLTSAQCTQLPISYVLLNTTKVNKDGTTAALHVIKTEKFPTFRSSESDRDVGLIYTEKHNSSIASKILLSNFTSSRDVIDMEVLGFGLNADVGQTKELQYIGAENRLEPVHPTDIKDELTAYFDCVDTKVLTCFKDFGGPSVFDNELVGVVMKGDDKCFKEISSTYSVNKKIANILPTYTFKAWLEENIRKNEEQDLIDIAAYPDVRPPYRRLNPQSTDENQTEQICVTFDEGTEAANSVKLVAFFFLIGTMNVLILSLI